MMPSPVRERVNRKRSTEQRVAEKPRLKVAYMMSRFPKITETFILYEILAVEQEDVEVELYPLQRERTTVMHAEAETLVERAHFTPFASVPMVRAHLRALRRQPREYAQTLWTLLRANWGSLRYFGGAVVFFPKAVYLAQEMKNAGIQHIHAHFASHPAAVAYVIHQLTGIPYSFTAHGSDLHRDRHMLREKLEQAAFAVTVSDFNKGVMLDECGEQYSDKILVIRCGVDTQRFQPDTGESSNGASASPFTILSIGTLHEVKGQTHLIAACRLLHERGLDFECHFIGDGPDEDALRQQAASAGLNGRLHFHGRQPREEIIAWLQRADVLAAPSVPSRDGRREGLPVVLIEAMGSGVPAVASDLSGIPELVTHEENGLLIPPGDVSELADALERLYRDGNMRRRLGAAGRSRVLREFDLHKNAVSLIEQFRMGGRT